MTEHFTLDEGGWQLINQCEHEFQNFDSSWFTSHPGWMTNASAQPGSYYFGPEGILSRAARIDVSWNSSFTIRAHTMGNMSGTWYQKKDTLFLTSEFDSVFIENVAVENKPTPKSDYVIDFSETPQSFMRIFLFDSSLKLLRVYNDFLTPAPQPTLHRRKSITTSCKCPIERKNRGSSKGRKTFSTSDKPARVRTL